MKIVGVFFCLLDPYGSITEHILSLELRQIPGVDTELALFQKPGELDIVDAVHMLFAALTQAGPTVGPL